MDPTTDSSAKAGEFLSFDAMAERLGVTRKTLERWRKLPDPIPTLKPGGRMVFFSWPEVRSWMLAQRERPTRTTPRAIRRRRKAQAAK